MEQQNQLILSLSDEELYVILLFLKAPQIAGFDGLDQINQLTDSYRHEILGVAERALIARGFFTVDENRSLKLLPPVFAAVGASAFPDYYIQLYRQIGTNPAEAGYFGKSENIFVFWASKLPKIHTFVVFESVKEYKDAISRSIPLGNYSNSLSNVSVLPNTVIDEMAKVTSPETVSGFSKHLKTHGMENDIADQFAHEVLNRKAITSLNRINREGNEAQVVEAMTFLEGEKYLWHMQSGKDEGTLELKTITRVLANTLIDKLTATA